MKSWSSVLEGLANLAIVVTCVALCVTLVARFQTRQSNGTAPELIEVGDRIDLQADQGQNSSRKLVLVLDQQCRYCEASVPFYRTLLKAAESSRVRVESVFPQTRGSGDSYLAQHQLKVDRSMVIDFQKAKLSVTPLVLLVEADGRVRQIWRGLLSPEQEQAVLAAAGS